MKILSVVGTRPNFMKVAPIIRAAADYPPDVSHFLVHTGQHYDEKMSESFFHDLGMPKPDVNLGVGSGSGIAQTADMMRLMEPVFQERRPDVVIVVGDVNSTLAAALTAKKLDLRLAHVEAGLRSGDRTMPEEINRLATDAISDDLFTTDIFANENLAREGIEAARVHFVGNVMIDSLLSHLSVAEKLETYKSFGVAPKGYATLTLHRPSNVDEAEQFERILVAIRDALGSLPVIFPVHPRTRKRIGDFDLGRFFSPLGSPRGIQMVEPLGYLEFLNLNRHARIVLTDSGGLQEETTILGVPCVTLRDNTERPITIEQGTNILAGTKPDTISVGIAKGLAMRNGVNRIPEKWDGRAADRIIRTILSWR